MTAEQTQPIRVRTRLATFSVIMTFGFGSCWLMPEAVAGSPVAQVAGTSPVCGPINGKTAKDMENVKSFCSKAITRGSVVSAYAMEMLLWVKVSRQMADAMRADRLSAEQLVLSWMKNWKLHSGSQVVTVTVEWGDVKIAEGQTTVFSGDKVTIR